MKKLLSILLVVSMLICLSSCGLFKHKDGQSESPNNNHEVEKTHYLPGNIVVTEETDGEKETTKTITISYNEQNLPSQIVVIDAGSVVEYTIDFTYDKNGNCVKEAYTDSDGETDTAEYIYDETCKLIKAVYKYNDGNRGECTYTYDNNDNLIKEVEVDSYSQGCTHIWDYTYDANGNLVKYLYRHSDSDKAIYYHTYSYDENGNLSEENYYDEDGDSLVFKFAINFTYDENGHLIKEVQTRESETGSERYAFYTIDYTYDENGALTKHVFTYYDGDKEIYEYNDYSFVRIASVFSSEDFLKYLREIM